MNEAADTVAQSVSKRYAASLQETVLLLTRCSAAGYSIFAAALEVTGERWRVQAIR